jgi:hypothetical protein
VAQPIALPAVEECQTHLVLGHARPWFATWWFMNDGEDNLQLK